MSSQDLAAEVKAKGALFAKNAGNKYGVPKRMKEKTPAAITTTKPADLNDQDTIKKEEDLSPYIVPASSSEIPPAAYVPSKSGESSASMTATAGPSAGSNTVAAFDQLIPKSDDLEQAVYFKSWGTPLECNGPPAGKRKVIVRGDPAWQFPPKPEFIASLVFGGPLEQIICNLSSAIVIFVKPEDAQAYYDATANGIVFHQTADRQHYAEIKLDNDVTPISSLVQQYIDNGATRCVKATGVDVVTPLQDLYKLGIGPMNSRGQIPRKLERLVDDMNASGHRVVTFRFCDIRHAFAFKAEVARMEDYEEVNFQYAADPVAEATGPRVEIRPSTRMF